MVILDDLLMSADQADHIVAVLRRCNIVTGSPHPVLGRRGTSRPLPGLSQTAALDLLGACLARALTGAEQHHARRLTAAVHGQPLHLKQAAALARAGQHARRARLA